MVRATSQSTAPLTSVPRVTLVGDLLQVPDYGGEHCENAGPDKNRGDPEMPDEAEKHACSVGRVSIQPAAGAKGHGKNGQVTYAAFDDATATPGAPQSRILPRIRGTTIGACSEQYSWSL